MTAYLGRYHRIIGPANIGNGILPWTYYLQVKGDDTWWTYAMGFKFKTKEKAHEAMKASINMMQDGIERVVNS